MKEQMKEMESMLNSMKEALNSLYKLTDEGKMDAKRTLEQRA